MATNKVIYYGETLIDLTGDNVLPGDVASGKIFHKADGTIAVGTKETEELIYFPEPTETILGRPASDFQTNIAIENGNHITGTLNYLENINLEEFGGGPLETGTFLIFKTKQKPFMNNPIPMGYINRFIETPEEEVINYGEMMNIGGQDIDICIDEEINQDGTITRTFIVQFPEDYWFEEEDGVINENEFKLITMVIGINNGYGEETSKIYKVRISFERADGTYTTVGLEE